MFDKTLITRRAAIHGAVLLALLLSTFFTATGSTAYARGMALAPVVPTSVFATDGAFSDHVQVSWTAVVDATYYEVYSNTADDSSTATLLGSPAASPFDDMTATPDTTYWYFVKACNVDGCSDFSASDSGFSATTVVIPAVPADVSATDGTFADHVEVSWTAVTGAATYEVYRNTSSDSATATLLDSPMAPPYEDMTAAPATLYWYFAKACNSAGCSDFSTPDTGYAGTLTVSTATFVSRGGQDGWVVEWTERSNKGGKVNRTAAVLNLGDSAADRQFRSILSFDTSTLPDNAFITGATLEIRRNRVVGRNPFYTLGNLLVDVAMPYFGTSALLAPEDFQAPAGMAAVGKFTKRPDSARWHSAVLNSTAYPFINLAGTTQFRLEYRRGDNDNAKPDLLKFFSGNGPVAYRPVLTIEYYTP